MKGKIYSPVLLFASGWFGSSSSFVQKKKHKVPKGVNSIWKY